MRGTFPPQAEEEKQNQKDEKRRLKEKEKEAKKEAKKQDKLLRAKANSVQSQPSMDDFRASADNPIPVFLENPRTSVMWWTEQMKDLMSSPFFFRCLLRFLSVQCPLEEGN